MARPPRIIRRIAMSDTRGPEVRFGSRRALRAGYQALDARTTLKPSGLNQTDSTHAGGPMQGGKQAFPEAVSPLTVSHRSGPSHIGGEDRGPGTSAFQRTRRL